MIVAIVGMGKIGLPLAVQAARSGLSVIGADIDPKVVAAVNDGRPPFPGEPMLDERLREVVEAGRLEATTHTTQAVRAAEVTVIVVPLVVDGEDRPDFTALDAATADVGRGLTPGHLVVYETTVPVGTTAQRLRPILERESGLDAGEGFALAYSPERVSSGSVFRDLRRYPKLVGGLDPASAQAAVRFYRRILDFDDREDLGRANGVWDLGTMEAAEFTKLAETTYRDVNIALANEFGAHAERLGLDIHGIIEAANSQPYSHIHRPGIAVGGHCIPVYPRFYLAGDPDAALPAVARKVNEAQPARLVQRVETAVGELAGKVVAVLGASYRGGVKETSFSGVFPVVAELERRGAKVTVHDPMYTDTELIGFGLRPHRLGEPCDVAVVQADHARYRTLRPEDLPGCAVVLDGRAFVEADALTAAGIRVITVGRS